MIHPWPEAAENHFKKEGCNTCCFTTLSATFIGLIFFFVTLCRIFVISLLTPRNVCVIITIFLYCCKCSSLTLYWEHAYSEFLLFFVLSTPPLFFLKKDQLKLLLSKKLKKEHFGTNVCPHRKFYYYSHCNLNSYPSVCIWVLRRICFK